MGGNGKHVRICKEAAVASITSYRTLRAETQKNKPVKTVPGGETNRKPSEYQWCINVLLKPTAPDGRRQLSQLMYIQPALS
jgi:hypothetical protein